MSMFGGGGDDFTYTPKATPLPPMRRDEKNEAHSRRIYASKALSTYVAASKHGGAAAPVKSYTAQLFNASGGGGI